MQTVSSSTLPEEDHEQNSSVRYAAAQKSTWVSVGVNVLLTAFQVFAGIFSGSQGLIADGLHSLSDLIADFVVLIANHSSKKNADDDHHYGHHRYENAASLVLGALLVAVGLGMLWSAVKKMSDPGSIGQVHIVGLYVAIASLIAKEFLFRYMLWVAQKIKSSLLIANAWHARSDAASSLVVAIGIGGNLLGYTFLDPVAALVVGLMVLRMGWSFSWGALHDLMDRAASREDEMQIRRTLRETPGVVGLHDLRTRKLGDLIMVDVHLEVDGEISVKVGHDIAVDARKRVLKQHRVLNVMTHVDPV